MTKSPRICKKGHRYFKTSDCPTCPVCEKEKQPKTEFLSSIAAPARRALENHGIQTAKQLAEFSEADILAFHGMGPGSLPKLRAELKKAGLSFKK